jgi:arylsulfatase A-like enzyme
MIKRHTSLLFFALAVSAALAHAAPQPNIVHILTDDLGWIDPAFAYKAERGEESVYETPNLDRLGASGTRFRQAYSPAPTCAPSRAAYMAGQWPAHTGVYHVMGSRLARAYNSGHSRIDPFYSGRLALGTPTIAEELGKAGYETAHIQKWHFGGPGNGYPTPLDYGFKFSWDWKGQYNDRELWNPKDKKTADFEGIWRPMNPHRLGDFPTSKDPKDPYCLDEDDRPFDAVVDLSTRWLDKVKDKPFFVNFCPSFVHGPFSTRDRKRLEHYCKKMGVPFPKDPGKINDGAPGQNNPYYAAMLDSLDWQVGKILEFLEKTDDPRNPGHKLIDNTYVIVSSDNGGLQASPVKDGNGKGQRETITDNRPLDGGKLTLEEGGIRIPFIVSGPGVPKGALNVETPVSLIDMFPTFMAIAGAKPGNHLDLDGANVLPVFHGETNKVVKADGSPRDTLYYHYPSVLPTSSIIIKGGWKLRLYHGGSMDNSRPPVALYHLYNEDGSPVDESESKNLADEMPEKRDALLADLQSWMKKYNAELPYKNAAKSGTPEPGSEKVPAVVKTASNGKTLEMVVEDGNGKSRIVDAKLVYTTNGCKLLRAGQTIEEWHQTPAKIDGARVTVEAPPGMTHGVIYLRDENDFMITSEHLPPFSGSPDAIDVSGKGVDVIKDGFAWKPGLISLINTARTASKSAASKNLDHAALDAEIAKAEKVVSQPANEKTYAPAMRGLRQAIRALDVPEAKLAALNWFPKNANW